MFISITECQSGTFGSNCNDICGKCLNGTSCNRETGVCTLGCADGYTGSVCKTGSHHALSLSHTHTHLKFLILKESR